MIRTDFIELFLGIFYLLKIVEIIFVDYFLVPIKIRLANRSKKKV